MANHPNRKVFGYDDIKGYLVPVSNRFKKQSLINDDNDRNWNVLVVLDWEDGQVYVEGRHGNGQSWEELHGDRVASKLKDLDYTNTGWEVPNQEACLDVARLIRDYLRAQGVEKYELPAWEKEPVWRVIAPAQFLKEGEADPWDQDSYRLKLSAIQRTAVKEMREVLAKVEEPQD